MRRSRLSKNAEKKTKNNLYLSILGIIIVVFLLAKFGVGILVGFSLFLAGPKDNQSLQNNSNQINFIAPPTLNPLPNATNSAKIIISGKATKDTSIELFINNDLSDETKTDKNGTFVFTKNLDSGSNQIKTRAIYKDKKSDFSVTFDVILKNTQPTLEVTSPSEGQSFKKDQNTVNVQGKTDQDVSVTVNGFLAVIEDNNNFSYILSLQNGDNEIKIVATDQAGNRSEKSLKVNYSQ